MFIRYVIQNVDLYRLNNKFLRFVGRVSNQNKLRSYQDQPFLRKLRKIYNMPRKYTPLTILICISPLFRDSYADKTTSITTTMSGIDTKTTGYYYHLCGVDYTITKTGKETKITEYLFLPFHMNVIGSLCITY